MKSHSLLLVLAACGTHDYGAPPPDHGSGTTPPPKVDSRPQTMSDVHAEPGGAQVWLIHSAVVASAGHPAHPGTSYFGVYRADDASYRDVLDTTGTLGKKIVFPPDHRVLLIARRDDREDVLVTVDTAALRPVQQRSFAGVLRDFVMSPSGRTLLATDDHNLLHVFDTERLVDQTVSADVFDNAAWDPHGDDALYVTRLGRGVTTLLRYDLAGADLGKGLPAPTVVATPDGTGGSPITLSADGRYLAAGGIDKVTIVTLATGHTVAVPGFEVAAFASDDRAVVWDEVPDGPWSFVLAAPATGAVTPTVTTAFAYHPNTFALHDHPIVLGDPSIIDVDGGPTVLYDAGHDTAIRLPYALHLARVYEPPGKAEAWMWSEDSDALLRLDLTTHQVTSVVSNVDSVDFLGGDRVVVGEFGHAVRQISMTGELALGDHLVLGHPDDAPAPYKLAAD